MRIGEQVMYGERLKITRVAEEIWLLDDADNGTGYVCAGAERAAVIDTCNGEQNYYEAVRTLTDLPLIVINTHAHGDHVGGNRFFEEAYLSKEELPYYRAEELCPAKPLSDGDVIDLGGKTLRVILFPGHTPGGICLLDEKDRVLFTGDSILGRTVWMFMKNSVPVTEMRRSLDRLDPFRAAFDTLLTGHSRRPNSPDLIDALKDACDVVIAGAPADRFGTSEIRGRAFRHCTYPGEEGMTATLVLP